MMRRFPMEGWVLLYVLAYLPNVLMTRLVTGFADPVLGRPLTGLETLPASLVINLVLTYGFIWASGWHRDAHACRVGGFRLPMPTRWTLLSGVGTALILFTVPLSLTFKGVSIPFIQLIMRGDILIIAPLVDLDFGLRVRWWSWAALVLVAIALFITLADRGGRILNANPALQQMLGYNETDIVGVSFIDISEESQRELTKRNVHGLLDGAIGNYHVQKRYEKRDGGLLWANVSASLIPAIDREGPRLAVIVEDVSSRKEAESALAATQTELARVSRFTAMGELVASIAHEVNQPLSAIVTNSQAALRWLARETPDYQEVVAALKRVNRDASLAGEVIARIRSFLSRGGIKRERLVARQILADLLQMLQNMLQEAAVRVDLRVAPRLPDLLADPVQLQQVLLNLVVNAVDAMRGQAHRARILRIAVTEDPEQGVLFSVSDTGPGIAPEMAAKIFDALFSTKSRGLGMGLAISRSIVENHGGRLRLLPEAAGGAHFVFNIPVQP